VRYSDDHAIVKCPNDGFRAGITTVRTMVYVCVTTGQVGTETHGLSPPNRPVSCCGDDDDKTANQSRIYERGAEEPQRRTNTSDLWH
jgi:hypothetical protein